MFNIKPPVPVPTPDPDRGTGFDRGSWGPK